MSKDLKKNVSKKALLIIGIIYTCIITIVVIVQAWMMSGMGVSQGLIDNYGYSQRVAYEQAVAYCNSTVKRPVCKDILIQSVTLYDNESGSGSIFTFSNTRHKQQDSIAIRVDVSKDGRVESVKNADTAVLDNNPLP